MEITFRSWAFHTVKTVLRRLIQTYTIFLENFITQKQTRKHKQNAFVRFQTIIKFIQIQSFFLKL